MYQWIQQLSDIGCQRKILSNNIVHLNKHKKDVLEKATQKLSHDKSLHQCMDRIEHHLSRQISASEKQLEKVEECLRSFEHVEQIDVFFKVLSGIDSGHFFDKIHHLIYKFSGSVANIM